MLAAVLGMVKASGPEGRLKRRTARQRARSAFLRDSRKPKMTPEEARRDHRQMLRFLGLNALVGASIGVMVAIAILLLDIGGIGHLAMRSSAPAVVVLLVVVPFASLFGGAAAASAILTLPYDSKYRTDEDDGAGEP